MERFRRDFRIRSHLPFLLVSIMHAQVELQLSMIPPKTRNKEQTPLHEALLRVSACMHSEVLPTRKHPHAEVLIDYDDSQNQEPKPKSEPEPGPERLHDRYFVSLKRLLC